MAKETLVGKHGIASEMLSTITLTLCSLLVGSLLAMLGIGSAAAIAHLAFAIGILPLIFAAMLHFIPVLTRSGEPPAIMRRWPFIAQIVGLTVVFAMQGWLPYSAVYAAATVDLMLAGILLRWLIGRARASLGMPHPGWRWYGGALVCLMLALLSILGMALWPAQWPLWRLAHVHLNTLGLVGLAALGTLPVLLPTAQGRPDPAAAHWLRHNFWLALGAVFLVVAGVVFYWPLSLMAATGLFGLILGLGLQWRRVFGWQMLWQDGASVALVGAIVGWLICLLAGALHAAQLIPARPTLWAWAAAGLLPLVTGAVSQLLPVWRWPGPRVAAHARMRSRLVWGGRGRMLLFLAAGLAFLGEATVPGALFCVVGMLSFAFSLIQAMRISRSTR